MSVDLVVKLADARDELFEYDRMVETQMINGPEHVIDEMVSEIKKLREALEFYADRDSWSFHPNGYDVHDDRGMTAREALK